MSKVKSVGYTDTAIEGVSSLTLQRGILNLGKDFRVKVNNPGKEVKLTNITCPTDRPEVIRIAYSDIPNVYSGTGIETAVTAPTKRGVSILSQITSVTSVTDSVAPDYRIDLPLSCHLVIKVPANENITADDVLVVVGRLLSSLFDSGVSTTSRLEAILRGSLVPSEL